MPVESKAGVTDRAMYTHLEGFARLLAGMAPWFELGMDKSREGLLRQKYIKLARIGLHNSTDPSSPDYMNFSRGAQPLVDAAFMAQALIRSPTQLWDPLDSVTKNNIIRAFKTTRSITPANNNWLLFSAMIETALYKFEGHCDTSRITYAIRKHMLWYKGDGMYGDGPEYHWDYYNSFVIHPILIEILTTLNEQGLMIFKDQYNIIIERAVRYAEVQERLISPEGTYPVIGRSAAYRFGAFQLLSKISLMHLLPQQINPAQVRSAMFALISKQLSAKGTFDKDGWLTIGLYGHQPGVGEVYISTGSLYLCAQAFLILGLPPTDPFWNGNDIDWTSRKILQGKDFQADHALSR